MIVMIFSNLCSRGALPSSAINSIISDIFLVVASCVLIDMGTLYFCCL